MQQSAEAPAGGEGPAAAFDHPIFSESVRLIRGWLGSTGLGPLEQEVLERLVHSSGDLSLAADLRFAAGSACWGVGAALVSSGAAVSAQGASRALQVDPETAATQDLCGAALAALAAGATILTDTAMAAAAVAPMARRTFGNPVHSVLAWAPDRAPSGGTRTAAGMAGALAEHPGAVVLIGSAPTALECLLERVRAGAAAPALVIGMPVGFVGVAESKRHLAASGLPQIRLEGSRGGAGLVAAAVNALLRRAWLDRLA
jgi:precorrin-8X/cobalt-precorrin-8 methylmutase